MSARLIRFCALSLILLTALTVDAATIPRLWLDSLVVNSDYILYGRVVQSRCTFDAATGMVWTRTHVQVLDAVKGAPGSSIIISEPGGTRDGIGEIYPGVPRFEPGQELVLFLYRTSGNRVRVTGAMQGLYRVRLSEDEGERLVIPSVRGAEAAYEVGSAFERQSKPRAIGQDRLSRFLYDIRQKVAVR